MKVERLVVGKGKTIRHSDAEEWIKEYYEIEVVVGDPAERKEQLERLGFIPSRRWMSPTKPLIQPGGRRWIELCLSIKKGETKKLEMKWPSVARNRIKNLIKRGLQPDEFEVRTSGQIVYITRKEK